MVCLANGSARQAAGSVCVHADPVRGGWFHRRISFEMYLWHFPMLILWDFVKDRVCMEERIWMAVFTVLVFILSAILYVAAEIPLTRRLDRLRDKDA